MALKTEQIILIIIIGVVLWLLLFKPTAETGSGIGNDSTPVGINCPGWNGVCTNPIKDACCPECEEVRTCAGQVVDNPYDCLSKYCFASDNWCNPVYQEGTDNFRCTCTDVEAFPD